MPPLPPPSSQRPNKLSRETGSVRLRLVKYDEASLKLVKKNENIVDDSFKRKQKHRRSQEEVNMTEYTKSSPIRIRRSVIDEPKRATFRAGQSTAVQEVRARLLAHRNVMTQKRLGGTQSMLTPQIKSVANDKKHGKNDKPYKAEGNTVLDAEQGWEMRGSGASSGYDSTGSTSAVSLKPLKSSSANQAFSSSTSGYKQQTESSGEKVKSLNECLQQWQLKAIPRILCSDATIRELHKLVTTPVPSGEILKCQIEVINHLDASRPFYVMTMPLLPGPAENELKKISRSEEQRPYVIQHEKRIAIMTGKKCGSSMRPHFVISLDPDDFTENLNSKCSKWYFGKLKHASKNCSADWHKDESGNSNRKISVQRQNKGLTLLSSTDFRYVLYDRGYDPRKHARRTKGILSRVRLFGQQGAKKWSKNAKKTGSSIRKVKELSVERKSESGPGSESGSQYSAYSYDDETYDYDSSDSTHWEGSEEQESGSPESGKQPFEMKTDADRSPTPDDSFWEMKPRKERLSVQVSCDSSVPALLQMSVMIPKIALTHSLAIDHSFIRSVLLQKLSAKERARDAKKALHVDEGRFEHCRKLVDQRVTMLLSKTDKKQKRPSIAKLVRYPVAPSVKNYELSRYVIHPGCKIKEDTETFPTTGLARIGAKRFFIVAQEPLTLYQAFATALARIDATKSYNSSVRRKVLRKR